MELCSHLQLAWPWPLTNKFYFFKVTFSLRMYSSLLFQGPTMHKCPSNHPVLIHVSDHIHLLTTFQQSWVSVNDHPSIKLYCHPTGQDNCFLSPFVQKRREVVHSVHAKAFLQPSPDMATLWVNHLPPVPPPMQGHYRKWHHKKVSRQLLVATGLTAIQAPILKDLTTNRQFCFQKHVILPSLAPLWG